MTSKRILGVALGASLLFAATACGDDDDDTATATTTTEAQGPTAIEVTLTSDGFDGMPSELPAGLVEITLVNETDEYASLEISRVTDGTTEDEFVEGLAPLLEGGAFPDFFLDNAGHAAEEGETQTSLIVLREGEHIVWWEAGSEDEGEEDDGVETESETETETVSETETEDTTTTTTTVADGDDETTTSTTIADETTTTAAGDEEQGASAAGQPTGTLTAVAAEDDETETDTDTETDTETDDGDGDEGEGSGTPNIVTAQLTVTAGDDSAELPEADGEIVARDYAFEATLEAGTINFRNDGPQQFHHAVVVDFGTNDPDAVEDAFPAILESEDDSSAMPDIGDIDMDEVDFDFAGSGVFGPEGSGTFEADIVEGNTYVLVCFIQDRDGGPPHAIANDMWDVVQAGGGTDTTTTTDG